MTKLIPSLLLLASLSVMASAQTNASATYTISQSGSNFTYDFTLHNLGTTNIGTFWFAWAPGQDYLPIAPSSTTTPSGWSLVQTTSAGFGTGLQWTTPAATELTPGSDLSGFSFTTTTTPGEIAGLSIFGTHPPVATTFVYEHKFAGLTGSGGSKTFVASAVPEPASLAVLGLGAIALIRRRRRS